MTHDQEAYDVVVVGGGAAGLSGALALARAGRSVLVVDAGQPRNARAGHVHNYLTRDGMPPAELAAAGRAEVARHGGQIVLGRVVKAAKDGDGFAVTLSSEHGGRDLRARRLLVATGLTDELTGVRLASGEVIELDALVVAAKVAPPAGALESLGLEPVDVELNGHVIGRQIPADPTGATAVPGVWAAGNVTDVRAQVISAAAAGLNVGAMINTDLIAAETRDAVDAYRHNVATMFEEAAWDERYGARPTIWSGNPNQQLIAEATDLTPGRALDVGAGEGADAIWLAQRGWRVTAFDISATALEHAATRAAREGEEVAGRIEWIHADLRQEAVAGGAYDLVSAHFMHLPGDARRDLFARLAAAVAPHGTLLIVGHHPSDLRTTAHRMHFPDMMYTAEEVASSLDPGAWEILAAQERPREAVDPDGRDVTIHDAVLVARRRA